MGSKKSYRVSGRFKDILDVLHLAKKSQDNFLWRSHKRDPIPIYIHEVYPDENTIIISLKEKGLTFRLEDEFYLRLKEKDSAFKTRVIKMNGDKIILEFPDEIALSEHRAEKRHYFHPSDGKTVQMKKIKNTSSALMEKTMPVVVADISQSGMALILSGSQSHHFQLKDRVLIDMIGPYRIKPPIIGEIIFKLMHDTQGAFGVRDKGAKIGLHLETKIPKATFDRFLVKETLFSITEQQIIRDQSFRKHVHDRMDSVLSSLKERKTFKNMFEKLEVKTSDSYYLKQHVQLLCEVICGLGTSLGWVSERTLDKLIYVSYLHDARYFNMPHLARIQSKREFDKLKKNLSFDEIKVFLEGPEYSAELAKQDTESHPDAEKILLQQKELPDGSGFPNGITTLHFTPLSCLFILSHFFVDYVLTHQQDWSIEDFVKSHQKTLKGQYFGKIFNVMLGLGA